MHLLLKAEDEAGEVNHDAILIQRDGGPLTTIISPQEGVAVGNKVTVTFTVADIYPLTSVGAELGGIPLEINKEELDEFRFRYEAVVDLNAGAFLSLNDGVELFKIVAKNENGYEVTDSVSTLLDLEGPQFLVETPKAGQLISGEVLFRMKVSDDSGVAEPSLKLIPPANLPEVPLIALPEQPGIYEATYSVAVLPSGLTWPTFTVSGEDALGNRASAEIQVGLDFTPPLLSLDPSSDFFSYRMNEVGKKECSRPYDPVGDDAVSDLKVVGKLGIFRARVEDQGNINSGTQSIPVAGVSSEHVRLWILGKGTGVLPLVADLDGDGFCDGINPVLKEQTVADHLVSSIRLSAHSVAGVPDFRPLPLGESFPFAECVDGNETLAPSSQCNSSLFFFLASKSGEPVIYSQQAADGCETLPIDFISAGFSSNQWLCVAVEAEDKLGNRGVSKPLRLYLDLGQTLGGEDASGVPPTCTGIYHAPTDTYLGQPCYFRDAFEDKPQLFPSKELRLLGE